MDWGGDMTFDMDFAALELTEHQMRSQKALYRSFCKSLEKTQSGKVKQDNEERILIGRPKRPEKLTFDEALRQVKEEMKLERKKLRDEKKKTKSSKSDSIRNKTRHESSIEDMLPSASGVLESYETDFEEDTEIHTETFKNS